MEEWRRIRSWLQARHDDDPEAFFDEWVQFHFVGRNAVSEYRDLIAGWSDFTGLATAASAGGMVGVAAGRRDRVFVGVAPDSLSDIEGWLGDFRVTTKSGTEIAATLAGIAVVGA